MRIAHVSATFPPYWAGTGNVCYHNARELARRGHEVQVLTAAAPGLPGEDVVADVQVRRLPVALRAGNAPLLPGLIGALRGFDIIHLHYPFILGAEMVSLAALLYRTPFVLSFHNDLIGNGLRAPVFALYQQLSARATARRASRLCAVSTDHYQSSRLRRALPQRPGFVVELPNGVDVERFAPTGPRLDLRERFNLSPEARVLLFVGALDRAHHFKGLDRLLLALRHLPPDVVLLVVGDGDLRPEYEAQAQALGLRSRVAFAGAVPHDDLPLYFRGADLTVLPSLPPESFGMVLIESLACGVPVVASNIPGVRQVVDHGSDGLLAKPGAPGALAAAIAQVLADDNKRRAMGERGRAKVEARYAWQAVGDRLEAIYYDLLGESRVHARAQWAKSHDLNR